MPRPLARLRLSEPLPPAAGRDFYRRETRAVARDLLGAWLVRRQGSSLYGARIVEVEAYLGVDDPAAHSYRGRRTARLAPMYLDGGHLYVFLVYGMHWCANVVTGEAGIPEAVLLRAAELPAVASPPMTLDHDRSAPATRGHNRSAPALRGNVATAAHARARRAEARLLAGPAKLARGLGLDGRQSGLDLLAGGAFSLHPAPPAGEILAVPRIGVDYAGEAARWPLRYYLAGSPAVSRH